MATLLGGTGLLLAACSSPVRVESPDPSGPAREACARLIEALPEDVEGQGWREVDPPGPWVAAWGDPAIVLRCGVGEPPRSLTAQLATVDGVDWFPRQVEDGYVFSTVGRPAVVEVRVPSSYAPEVNPLVDLADAILSAVPEAD